MTNIEARLERMEAMLEQLLNKPQEESDMITTEAAAAISGLSVKTLLNYISAGKLTVTTTKIGRRLMLNRAQFIRWNSAREFWTPVSA